MYIMEPSYLLLACLQTITSKVLERLCLWNKRSSEISRAQPCSLEPLVTIATDEMCVSKVLDLQSGSLRIDQEFCIQLTRHLYIILGSSTSSSQLDIAIVQRLTAFVRLINTYTYIWISLGRPRSSAPCESRRHHSVSLLRLVNRVYPMVLVVYFLDDLLRLVNLLVPLRLAHLELLAGQFVWLPITCAEAVLQCGELPMAVVGIEIMHPEGA